VDLQLLAKITTTPRVNVVYGADTLLPMEHANTKLHSERPSLHAPLLQLMLDVLLEPPLILAFATLVLDSHLHHQSSSLLPPLL